MADGSSTLAIVMLVFLLVAVVGLIVVAIVELPKLRGSINSVIVLIETGVVSIEGVAVSLFDQIESLLSLSFDFVANVATDIAFIVSSGVKSALNAIEDLGTELISTINTVFNNVQAVVLTIVDGVVNFYGVVIQPIVNIAISIYNTVFDFVALITCYLSNLICCKLGASCQPPAALNCCTCSATCPPGKVCNISTGQCTDP